MENAWIAVIGTLLGVVIGGLGSYFVKRAEFRHELKKENKKLFLSKLEQLHQSIRKIKLICKDFVTQVTDQSLYADYAPHEINFKTINELIDIETSDFYTLQKIYLPEASGEIEDLCKKFEVLGNIGSDYLFDSKPDKNSSQIFIQLSNVEELLQTLEDKLIKKIHEQF